MNQGLKGMNVNETSYSDKTVILAGSEEETLKTKSLDGLTGADQMKALKGEHLKEGRGCEWPGIKKRG